MIHVTQHILVRVAEYVQEKQKNIYHKVNSNEKRDERKRRISHLKNRLYKKLKHYIMETVRFMTPAG